MEIQPGQGMLLAQSFATETPPHDAIATNLQAPARRDPMLDKLSLIELTHVLAEAELHEDGEIAKSVEDRIHRNLSSFVLKTETGGDAPQDDQGRDRVRVALERFTAGMVAAKEDYKADKLRRVQKSSETIKLPILPLPQIDSAPDEVVTEEPGPDEIPMPESDSFVRNYLKSVKVLFGNDFKEANAAGKLKLVSALGTIAADRSRLMMIYGIPFVADSYLKTGDQTKAALTLGSMVYGQQFITGAMTRIGIEAAPRTLEHVDDKMPAAKTFARTFARKENRIKNTYNETMGGFALGATPFVASEILLSPETNRLESLRTSQRVSLKVGAFTTGLVATLLTAAEEYPTNQVVTKSLDLAQNSLFLTGLFFVPLIAAKGAKEIKNTISNFLRKRTV